MKLHHFVSLVLVAPFTLPLSGCGDDPAGGGPTDTSPPTIAAVTPVDVNHLQVTFSESVNEPTAESPGHYRIVEGTVELMPASPGDTVAVSSAVLDSDGRTVLLTTGDPMQNLPYDLFVSGVKDLAGNRITGEASSSFTGSNAPDETAPTILSHIPAANATNVPLAQAVVIQFSESMNYPSVLNAFTWASGAGDIVWEVVSEDEATFAFLPLVALERNTNYTVTLGAAARDRAGNSIASTTWSFRTTSQTDNTAPTLVASDPADGATRVPLASNLSMTFSEALQPYVEEILVAPEIGKGVLQWSNDSRTFTYDPYVDLLPDTQYSLLVLPGGVKDLAGNGNVTAITIVFTTAAALANGSFAGTLGGDAGSSWAADPAGAIVVASDQPPFGERDPKIVGTAVATAGGGYVVGNLLDGTYWAIAIKDANDDGRVNPERGDAIGVYGVDFASQTGTPDRVTIVGGGDLTGIDFDLFDPVALSGRVVYEGNAYPECCYPFYVGVFDTTGFDPNNPIASEPLYTASGWIPNWPEWWVNQLENGLQPGTYYVGAFMDANLNHIPDGGDPLALYESGGVPVPVTVADGSDVLGIDIHLLDPIRARSDRPVAWPSATPPPTTPLQRRFRSIFSWLQEAVEEPRAPSTP